MGSVKTSQIEPNNGVDLNLISGPGGYVYVNGQIITGSGSVIIGPQGDMGPTGSIGDTGATGATGPKGDTGEQGIPGIDGAVLPAGLTWSGTWSGTQSYLKNHVVGYASASWWSKNNIEGKPFPLTPNSPPDIDNNNWALLATQGPVGPQGLTGPTGIGLQGIQGIQGPTGATGGIMEAPIDGNQYVRKDGDWLELEKSNSYSLEETLTGGTWIDGKPIYRRVVTGQAVLNDLDIGFNYDIDNLITSEGYVLLSNNDVDIMEVRLPYFFIDSTIEFNRIGAIPYISINNNNNRFSTLFLNTYTFILEYTKTTD